MVPCATSAESADLSTRSALSKRIRCAARAIAPQPEQRLSDAVARASVWASPSQWRKTAILTRMSIVRHSHSSCETVMQANA